MVKRIIVALDGSEHSYRASEYARSLAQQENHPLHFVLVEEGLLIAHGAVVWKYLAHAGETYKAYGLSGVFIHPSFRERGYGRQIIEAGTAYIRNSEADIGLLWCAPSLKGFYARR